MPETHIAPNHTPTIADTVPKWLNTPTLLLQLMQLLWPLVTTRVSGFGRWKQEPICMVLEWTLGLKRLAYSRIDLSLSVLQRQSTSSATSQGNMGDQTFCVSLVLVSFTLIYRAACPFLVKHSTIITSEESRRDSKPRGMKLVEILYTFQ